VIFIAEFASKEPGLFHEKYFYVGRII